MVGAAVAVNRLRMVMSSRILIIFCQLEDFVFVALLIPTSYLKLLNVPRKAFTQLDSILVIDSVYHVSVHIF